MFGFAENLIAAESLVSALEYHRKEQKNFEALCNSLPNEEAEKLRAERKKTREENLKHQRALEIAREGRSLNFWGER